jgi:excisionase family DNA binding protein
MTDTVTKLKVEDSDLKRVKDGIAFLERAATLAHGGLFLTTPSGENLFAEMPASVLRLMQRVMATMVDSHEAFLLRADEEVSPEKAAELLGVSRPIVYQRMDSGRLPFRQVGTHRRIRAADIAELKRFEDRRQTFAAAISADTEELEAPNARPSPRAP